jgi:hypothetical protein
MRSEAVTAPFKTLSAPFGMPSKRQRTSGGIMDTQIKQPMSRRDLLAKITILANEGHSAQEIAKQLSENPRRVARVARVHHIRLAGAGGRRRVSCGVKRKYVRTLDDLALAANVSRSIMAERILSSLLEDGGRNAIKLLGKEVRPKRKYKPRVRKVALQNETVQ